MPSRYESEGQYSPRNLMNIVNSASSIVNSIGKAENQGLIREDRAKKKKILDATNKAQEVMVAGATPEEAQTHLQGQTEYNDPGWFDKIMGEKEGQIKSFTPATAELGYQNALKLRNQSADATTDNYTNTYRQQMSKMPIKDISNFDFNKAENPYAARKAQGELLSLYGNSQVAKERSAVATEKNGQRMFQHYEGGVIEAKAALAKGNKKEARKMAHKLVNELNNNSYKAKDSGEGMKLGVTYDGVDKWDDKEIPVEELIGHLEQITKDKYMDSFHKNAEFHRKVNAGTAENPLLFVNKDGGIAKVMTEGESFTSGHNVVVFGPDNKKIPITDLKDLYKMGYTPYKQKAGTSNTGKSGTGTAPKNVTKNMKVLKQAMEMVKTQGSYRVDPSTGTVTDSEGNDVGSQYIEEVLRIMPELGGALETGDVTKLKQMFHIPESGGIADDLLNNSAGLNRSPNVVSTARQVPNTW